LRRGSDNKMYNSYDINRIDKQIDDLQRLKASYMSMVPNQPPVNNFINTQPNKPIFEAKFSNENPADVLVQNKTAFINLKANKLTIKEVDGEYKEYEIIPPKDEKDIRIQQLENEINTLKENYINLQLANSNNIIKNTVPVKEVSATYSQPLSANVTETTELVSQEPMMYNLKEDDYSVQEQQSFADKIGSKLKFKK
jgi:hypothetical protein